MGMNVFAGCVQLSNLIIDYENISSIPTACFQTCKALPSFNAPNCSIIYSNAFKSCTNLSMVSFPKVNNLKGSTFINCGLESIELPLCSSAGYAEFQSCNSLTKADLPLILRLEMSFFESCTALMDVSIPSCSSLYSYAFKSCTSLSFLSLPALNNIYPSVFMNCTSLETLVLTSTTMVKLSNSNAFNNTPMNNSTYLGYFGSIYVPSDLVDSYKASTNWTYLSDRITSIENLPTT
jgi:hypothetical protein